MGYDFFVLGEYDKQQQGQTARSTSANASSNAKARRPLSAVIMESVAHARPAALDAAVASTPLRRSTRLRLRSNAVAAASS